MKKTTKKIKVAIAVAAMAAGGGVATVSANPTTHNNKISHNIEREYNDVNHYVYNEIHQGEIYNHNNNGIKTILEYHNNRLEGVMVNTSSTAVKNSSLYLHYRDGDKINIHESGSLEPGHISVISIPNPKYKNNDHTIGLEVKIVENNN